ncbi:MAG TPA: hypothetical protein VFC19_21175 [Candidatus Limnocylindrales bacterium]|nr:hypothetical protein [Candidatus Limnocylindrales bacterium]
MRRLAVLATLSLLAAELIASPAHADGIISSLSVFPVQVRDGASATGTVTLIPLDSNPTTVLVFSSDPNVAQVPPSVIAPAGASTVDFNITTNAAAPPTIVQITAWIGNTPRSANLSVNAATPPGPSLTAVSVVPSTLTGGSPATGTVTFTAATDGALVQLVSGNTALVQVPFETTVRGGDSSGAFPVTTAPVTANTNVTITANWFGVSRSTTITLTPGAPAPADVVRITRARWRRGLLTIEATSTNPNAILSVFSQSGSFMFTLTNLGGGRYFDQRGWVFNPNVIVVKSNLGGSATAQTTS